MAGNTLPADQLTAFYFALFAVCFPFIGFLKNLILPDKFNDKVSIYTLAASVLCCLVLLLYRFNEPEFVLQTTWFVIGKTVITAGIWLNHLSMLMLLLVSLIALAVHIYSVQYMEDDERYPAYFTYLSFFTFAMMGLVIAPNLIQLYFFWELVGFASYLLIGFWYEREKASSAAKKAFIMNRIGDVGFLIGIFIIFNLYNTFNLTEVNGIKTAEILARNPGSLTVASLCFFLGAMAKSAQFPLFTWLPDAMEGPTAVSSLLHAATMVAAGVFLMARLTPVFTDSALLVMAVVGAVTAFLAAYMALTQKDLKRILAFSTISQLGFMMLAIGIEAQAAAIFHLITHAFFKCLLFLSAGVVIHYMGHFHDAEDSPQDITRMGGLRKKLPFTFAVCSLAALALAGIPFTSGYLSKDAILIQAFEWAEGKGFLFKLIPLSALITSWLTAFYISRLIFTVFFERGEAAKSQQLIVTSFRPSTYEPKSYWMPMLFLALCSLFIVYSWNPFSYEHSWIFASLNKHVAAGSLYHILIPVVVNLGTIGLIYLAYQRYVKNRFSKLSNRGFVYKLSFHQLYLDRFYELALVPSVLFFSKAIFAFDRYVVDGVVNGTALFTRKISSISSWFDGYVIDGFVNQTARISGIIGHYFRNFQSGRIQRYLTLMLFLLLLVCLIFVFI